MIVYQANVDSILQVSCMYKNLSGAEDRCFLSDAFFKMWRRTKPGEQVVTCSTYVLLSISVQCNKLWFDWLYISHCQLLNTGVHSSILSGLLCREMFSVEIFLCFLQPDASEKCAIFRLQNRTRVNCSGVLVCRSFDETAYKGDAKKVVLSVFFLKWSGIQ